MTAPTEEGTVELPKLPDDLEAHIEPMSASDLRTFIEDYARAAVLADRASRSPVVGAVGGEPTEEQKDAARYRWLRAKTAERHEDFYADVDRWSVSKERRGTGQCFSSDRLDAAIDAAMGGIGVSPTGSPEGEVSNG